MPEGKKEILKIKQKILRMKFQPQELNENNIKMAISRLNEEQKLLLETKTEKINKIELN